MSQTPQPNSTPGNRRGAVSVVAAICLVLVIAFLAFAIDLGYIVNTESELQNAADAAALSGARALPDREAAIAAAISWAGKNIAAGQSVTVHGETDVEIGTWDEHTATFTALPANSPITPNAVKVTCQRTSERGNPLRLSFAHALGTSNASVTVTAVAQNKGGSCGGIMALVKIYLNDRQVGRASYTDSYDSNRGDYHSQVPGDNGDICTNGHLTLNGNSHVNGDARWWEQANSPNADESQVSGEFKSFEEAIEFPEVDPGDAATNNSNSTIPLSNQGKQAFVNGAFTLTGPADEVTLQPGTYYFTTMTVGGGSKVYTTGPTYIYVLGTVDLKYGGLINQTRRPINLQIYPMGADTYFYLPFFGELHASIYSTKAHIYLDERSAPVNLHFFGKMVGQKIRVWDTALHVDESISFGALMSGGEQIGKSGITLVQ